jgi:hypothetical protein
MNLDELAQPKPTPQPAQVQQQSQTQQTQTPQAQHQPAQQQLKSMKIQNVTKLVVTTNGKVALVQLHGAGEQMHYVKLPSGDVLQLHLVTPIPLHITLGPSCGGARAPCEVDSATWSWCDALQHERVEGGGHHDGFGRERVRGS